MMPCLVLLENNYNVSVKMRKYGKNVFTGQLFQSFALKIRIQHWDDDKKHTSQVTPL